MISTTIKINVGPINLSERPIIIIISKIVLFSGMQLIIFSIILQIPLGSLIFLTMLVVVTLILGRISSVSLTKPLNVGNWRSFMIFTLIPA